jgi:hypothetical protein
MLGGLTEQACWDTHDDPLINRDFCILQPPSCLRPSMNFVPRSHPPNKNPGGSMFQWMSLRGK